MTVKSFAESNNLTVDKVFNLCQKLEIDVQKESDSLSEDDQMLLEYELEELEKANSGVADGGGAGGGESSSSSKKKKSDSDSDGSDFHIDNPTFSKAYKCLVDAVNMLENGLGDLSGLNQNGKNLIGSTENDAKLYNGNLSQINKLSRGLQNQMTNTIILLSRMNYKNANYFKDTLGDLLKEGKDEYRDYKSSDEYRDSLIPEWLTDEVDEFFKLVNGGTYNYEDELGMVVKDSVGYAHMNIDEMKQKAEELGISDVKVVSDFITKMDGYNQFFDYASSDANVISTSFGLGSLSNIDGLIDKAAEYGLSGDLTIQNFINQSDDNNKKIEDEEEKLITENSYLQGVAEGHGCKNFVEYINSLESENKDILSNRKQISEEQYALATDPTMLTQIAIEKMKEEDYYLLYGSSFDACAKNLVLGFTYEYVEKDNDGNIIYSETRFAENILEIPIEFRNSGQRYTFDQIQSTDEGKKLYDQVGSVYSNNDGFSALDFSDISTSISSSVVEINDKMTSNWKNYGIEMVNYANNITSFSELYSGIAKNNMAYTSNGDFAENSQLTDERKNEYIEILNFAVNDLDSFEVNAFGERVITLDEKAVEALYVLNANGYDDYKIDGIYLHTPEGMSFSFESSADFDLATKTKFMEVAKTSDSGVEKAFTLSDCLSVVSDVFTKKNQEFVSKNIDAASIGLSLINNRGITVSANGDEAKYIVSDLVSGTGQFHHNGVDGKIGTKVWYYDDAGRKIDVTSVDLKNAIVEFNMNLENPPSNFSYSDTF